MKRVAITGAGGSIGSSLTRAIISMGATVCAIDNSEDALFRLGGSITSTDDQNKLRLFLGDIRDRGRLLTAFDRVDTIFHCAAVKHVGLNEYNPTEAVKTNILGTENIIEAAIEKNVHRVVYTSSDKAVNPTNTMGATKLLGEKLCIAANNLVGTKNTRISCVRFGNVLNTNGSVARIFKQQLEDGRKLSITDPEMSRFYITMREAVQLCLEAAKETIGGEIFVRNMGSARVLDIAKAVAGSDEPNIVITGKIPGEKDYEELMTDTESSRAISYKNMIVILPELNYLPEIIQANITERYAGFPKVSGSLISNNGFLPLQKLREMVDQK